MTGEPKEVVRFDVSQETADFIILATKYKEQIIAMCQSGIFDLRNASAKLDFDPNGVLLQITTTQIPYRRKRGVIIPISIVKEN